MASVGIVSVVAVHAEYIKSGVVSELEMDNVTLSVFIPIPGDGAAVYQGTLAGIGSLHGIVWVGVLVRGDFLTMRAASEGGCHTDD